MFEHLIMLRHGATPDSMAGLFTGRRDVALSPEGREQATAWRSVLQDQIDRCWVSPLARAQETAMLAGLQPCTEPSLTEWDMGSLEGVNAGEFRASHPGWSLLRQGAPDGSGETPEDVWERAAYVGELLRVQEKRIVAVVSHGQFLRVLAVSLLGLSQGAAASLAYGPCRASVITRRENNRLVLTGWNVPSTVGSQLLSDLT